MPNASRQAAAVVGHPGRHGGLDSWLRRVADSVAPRLPGLDVHAAFLGGLDDGPDALAALAERLARAGFERLLVLPFFAQYDAVAPDMERRLSALRARLPAMAFDVLPPLAGDPALTEMAVDWLAAYAPPLRHAWDGPEIERRSHEVVAAAADGFLPDDPDERRVALRVAHATGDPAFVRRLLFRPGAAAAGRAALAAGRGVFADVNMLVAGMTRLPAPAVCLIGDPAVREAARAQGGTRAAAAVALGRETWGGGLFVVGNAPTAIWAMLDEVEKGAVPPALTVGLPVGFIGAREAKQALWESGLPCVTNIGPRGGTAAAAAAVNALCPPPTVKTAP